MADDLLLSVTGVDAYAQTRQGHIYFPPATTVAQIQSFVTALAPLWEIISATKITKAELGYRFTLPASSKVPTAAVKAKNGANFSFDTPGRFNFGFWLPGIEPGKLGTDGETVDLVDTDVANVTTLITDGTGGAVPSDGYGNDVGNIMTGFAGQRK